MDKNNEIINIVGEVVDVSEHKTYLELTSRVCYYDEPNLNGDMMPYDDTTLEKAQTLVNMPVQGKYKVNSNGEPTFGSHEMVKKRDGSVEFKTSSIGTHTEVYIENDDVIVNGVTKNLPCLFAKYRIWKRYKNVVAAVRRLFSLGKLFSSWETNTYQYLYENGIRKMLDYEFLSNCLLGYEFAYPSYGENASAISMAQAENSQLMIAEALSQDLLDKNNINDKEENQLAKKNENVVVDDVVVSSQVDTENTDSTSNVDNETNSVDSAQLTSWDLRRKIEKACREKLDKWCYIPYFFPNEKEAWVEVEGRDTELDYVKITYEVGEDDTITLSEPESVKLTVSIAEVNTKIAELEKAVETAKAEVDIKNDAITKASESIQTLKNQVAELTPYKEQAEIAERQKIEEEISAEKNALKTKLLKGNFTEVEIAEKEIADLIEARDTSAINSLIADRFIASIDAESEKTISETETSTDNDETAVAGLEIGDTETDVRSFMNKVLF